MTLSEHFAADEEAQAEARGDELIALWAWLKRIEEMKYDMGKHKVVGWDAWTAGSIR